MVTPSMRKHVNTLHKVSFRSNYVAILPIMFSQWAAITIAFVITDQGKGFGATIMSGEVTLLPVSPLFLKCIMK